MTNVIKENWNKVDETCPHCNQVTKRVRGITKQNLKRLITPKFDVNELVFTFMLVMILVLAFSYRAETKQCREWIGPMFDGSVDQCIDVCSGKCREVQMFRGDSNISTKEDFNLTEKLIRMNDVTIANESLSNASLSIR